MFWLNFDKSQSDHDVSGSSGYDLVWDRQQAIILSNSDPENNNPNE